VGVNNLKTDGAQSFSTGFTFFSAGIADLALPKQAIGSLWRTLADSFLQNFHFINLY
jgi:hypothetical protein